MNTDEIIEAAIQGHASTRDAIRWAIEKEREACLKEAIHEVVRWLYDPEINEPCKSIARSIRARGNE